MRDDCIQAVSQALGRPLTQAQAADIEKRIATHIRLLGASNRTPAERAAWLGMSREQRLSLAARNAAREIAAEAAKKQQRIALTVLAHDRTQRYLEGQGGPILDHLDRLFAGRLIAPFIIDWGRGLKPRTER
jgi:predicted Fe-S protein YdhL (DUF1289 family)